MKKENLIILAAAGLGLFVLSKVAKGGTILGTSARPAAIVNGSARTSAVDWNGTDPGNGTPFGGNNTLGYMGGGTGLTLNEGQAGYQVANVYDPIGYLGIGKL